MAREMVVVDQRCIGRSFLGVERPAYAPKIGDFSVDSSSSSGVHRSSS